MNEAQRKLIDEALEKAGLKAGRVAIGTYETGEERKVGVYFHYKFTKELANALINLAMQDRTVREGLKDLRQNFDLILRAVDGAKVVEDKKVIH
jgi:hypothetical protein